LRIWVIAAMWMAWPCRRFPRLLSRQALPLPGGHLDRRGPVIGGEVIPAGKPGHVADIADHRGGDDRADPEQPGQARPGRSHGDRELLAGLPDPGIDPAQVLQEPRGELPAGRLHRPFWPDRPQDPGGASCGDRLGDTAGDQLAQHRMQPADHLGPAAAQVTVPFGPDLQHRRVIIGPHLPDTG
jgi:hypothetical protein